MVWLGAVLCEQELEPDERKESICDLCGRCVEICPVHALENSEMEQTVCWEYAFGDDQKTKFWNIYCHKCRDICPYHLGTENSWTGRKETNEICNRFPNENDRYPEFMTHGVPCDDVRCRIRFQISRMERSCTSSGVTEGSSSCKIWNA